MNIYQYNVLKYISKKKYVDRERIAEFTRYPLKRINNIINELMDKGYLNKDLDLTDKANEEIKIKKPKNAIILADGLGMGMLTTSMNIPNGLLKIHGEVLIERLIRQLHEVGIYNIDIIIGFLKEKYTYLKDKYKVNLIYNSNHAAKNTIHSLGLVVDKISNSYILPSDIWTEQNPFSNKELYSWYSVSDVVDDDSTVRVKPKWQLISTEEGRGGNTMIGISYLLEKDAKIVRDNIRKLSVDKSYDNLHWEDSLFDESGKMIVYPKVYGADQVYKINDYEQLRELDGDTSSLDPNIISLISRELDVEPEDIHDIFVLEMGKTNRSFRFSLRDKQYIMRVPGEGTDQLINRKHEYDVYNILKGRNISDKVVYMSPTNGYKIAEFLEGARTCDPHDREDVFNCMQKLREFHSHKLEVNHEFNIFEKIDFYEGLRKGNPSRFSDYLQTKEKVMELKDIIDSLDKEWILSHIDSVPGNFLLANNNIYLIDWEYAAMQDPHLDIAMFALSAMYEREDVDRLIDSYFVEGYDKEIQLKIYCYMAVGGLLWSNWCEYKGLLGVDFGKYSLRQYQYAKEYYKIIKDEFKDMVA